MFKFVFNKSSDSGLRTHLIQSTIITFGIGANWLRKMVPDDVKNAKHQIKTREWINKALPFLLIGSLQIITSKTDIIMLGVMKTTTEVGIYRVSNQFAWLIMIVLVILSTGLYLCSIATSVGFLLTMTNHEKDATWIVALSALLNVILNAILIPRYSINRAALATTISTLIMNVGAMILVFKRLKINPTIFSFKGLERNGGNNE